MAVKVNTTEALKKLDAQLECSLCLDYFKQPKLLPCFHVFCESPCLEKLVAKDGHSLTCPTCRHIVPLTEKGVAGLQSDFHIDHLFEIRDAFHKAKDNDDTNCGSCEDGKPTGYCNVCGDFLCDECRSAHKRVKLSRNHTIVSLDDLKDQITSMVVPSKKSVPNCPKHSDNALKIYCDTCSTLICTDCTVRFHKDHNYDLVIDVIDQHKEELASTSSPLKEKLESIEQALKDFDKQAMEINNQKTKIEAEISREIDEQYALLDERKAELEGELEMLTSLKQKDLATQRDLVEILRMKLSSCLEYIEGALKTGTDGEVLGMKSSVLKRIEQISTDFDSDTLLPMTVADVELILSEKETLQKACQGFLEIDHGRSLSIENSITTGNGLKNATLGEQNSINFEPFAENKRPFRSHFSLKAELVHIKSSSTVTYEENAQGNGPHEISYCPVYRGKHELRITVNEISVKGSPFSVAVTGLGKPIRVIRGLKRPRGVVVNSKKQLVVVDSNGTSVSVLTAGGFKIQNFGTLKNAHGVTVDQDDNIYVVEESKCCVQKFSKEGILLAKAGCKGSGNLEFNNPIDICFNYKDGNLYVPDQNNHRIQVLTTDLTFVRTFGTCGNENGQFKKPLCVAFDSVNNLYVTEQVNCRIQVFSASGQFLRTFSYDISGFFPLSIAIDSNDTVYISDISPMHSFSSFTSTGVLMPLTVVTGTIPRVHEKIRQLGDGMGANFGLFVDHNDCVVKSNCVKGQLQIY